MAINPESIASWGLLGGSGEGGEGGRQAQPKFWRNPFKSSLRPIALPWR